MNIGDIVYIDHCWLTRHTGKAKVIEIYSDLYATVYFFKGDLNQSVFIENIRVLPDYKMIMEALQ